MVIGGLIREVGRAAKHARHQRPIEALAPACRGHQSAPVSCNPLRGRAARVTRMARHAAHEGLREGLGPDGPGARLPRHPL
eukprot:6314620-Alexandrium_andersonii.AAC.1